MEKTLPEVCIIQYGFPFDSSKFCSAEGVPLVRIRDVVRGYSETYTTEIAGENYIVNDGDLLIGMDGEFNIAYWKGGRAYLNQRVCRLIPREDVDRDYIFYYMPQALKAIEDATPFVTVKHLSAKQLSKILIPLPDMSEQQRISAVLRSVDRVIAMRKKELDELNNLVKSRFVELFGDPVADSMKWGQLPLSYYLKSIRYGTSTPPSFSETGYEFIRATNIKNGQILSSDMKYISEEEAKKIEKCKVFGGEMIIVRSGVNAGDTCIITGEHCGQYAGYDMILVFGEALHPVFANVLINTEYMDRVVKPLTRRAAQPHLNSEQVQSFPIIQVPYAQQEQFAAFVEQTDKSKYYSSLSYHLCRQAASYYRQEWMTCRTSNS